MVQTKKMKRLLITMFLCSFLFNVKAQETQALLDKNVFKIKMVLQTLAKPHGVDSNEKIARKIY